jgi:hypothetical protein
MTEETPPVCADDAGGEIKCAARLRDGQRCRFAAREGSGLCGVHRRTEEECPVCLDPLAQDRRELACGHCFHRACLRTWFRRGALTCPLCRRPCPEQAPLASRTLLGRVVLLGAVSLATLRDILARAPWVRDRDRSHVLALSYQSFTLDNFYEYLRRR